jgi:Tfp pilus assembly protein PilZ
MFRIYKRIDYIYFYNAYMVAQDNSDIFLQSTEKYVLGNDVSAVDRRVGRNASMVK